MIITHSDKISLPDKTFVAIDTEWAGLDQNRLHRPISGKFVAMTVCYRDGNEYIVHVIQDSERIEKVLNAVSNTIWVFHNAKFDIAHLRRFVQIPQRKIIDTMLMERVLWNGYYMNFSLQDLVRRYLLEQLDKSLQDKFDDDMTWNADFEKYAATDAMMTLRVWEEQKKLIDPEIMRIYEIDMNCMWAVLDFQSFRIDVEKWRRIAEENKRRSDDIYHSLPFNPRSPKQVKAFFEEHGITIPDTNEDTLRDLLKKHENDEIGSIIQKILDCRMFSKRSSTYGYKFVEKYLEERDGLSFVHPNYNITGAETGRMSANDPPMHQIPSRETKEFRECFIARPGHKLIIGDYSQQEVFLMAYISGDKRMMEICNSGKDIYIEMAYMMYNTRIEKSDPLRARMKAVVLGTDYGMSEFGLAKKEGLSVQDAKEIIEKFYSTFPGVARYIQSQKRNKKFVKTIYGRKIWLNPYSNQAEKNALNAPIQGSGADMLKIAIAKMHSQWKFDCPFGVVEVTHDEIGLDVPEHLAEEVKNFVSRIMIETANEMCPGMNFRADVKICDTWADKD